MKPDQRGDVWKVGLGILVLLTLLILGWQFVVVPMCGQPGNPC